MTEPSPTAAVLIIGDEVLSGRTQDTNLNTLARFLGALGIDLLEARTVGDRKGHGLSGLRSLQVGFVQHCSAQVRTAKIRILHVGVAKVCSAQIRSG